MPTEKYIRKTAIIAISLVTFAILSPLPQGVADSPPRKILTGWIPYYSMKTSLPSAIANGDLIKEVMPFWFTLKSATNIVDLYTPSNNADPTKGTPMSVPLAAMRDSGFSIIPTITDGTAKLALANILAVPSTRSQLEQTITNFVLTNNFDGIDLDFENFAFADGNASWPATKISWDAFIQELSVMMHSYQKILSVTTPVLFDPATGKKGYYVYDWAGIAPYIDRLRIMTYDYSTSSPGPIGPLGWAVQALTYAVSVVPSSKVYLGLPGYGRDWVTKVVGLCPSSVANVILPGAPAAVFVMRNAASLASSYGAVPTYNSNYGEVTFSYQKVYSGVSSSGLSTSCTASRTAWYQDARSYAARAQLVATYHLGGITAWTLGMEDPTATDAVRQVAQAIAPDQVTSTLSLNRNSVPYGTTINLSGLFQLPDKTPVSGLTVHVQLKESGESIWREIFQSATGPGGSVNAAVVIGKSGSLRLTTDGTWEQSASQSAESKITIGRLLDISPPTSAMVRSAFSISGVVQPLQAGVAVTLQGFVSGKWTSVAAPVATDENGQFTFDTVENRRGVARYRVSVSGDDNLQGTTSPIFAIVIY